MVQAPVQDFRSLVASGDAARRLGAWREALSAYRLAISQGGTLAAIELNIAICEFALGHFKMALAHAATAARMDVGLWQALLITIKALRALGRNDEALAVLALIPAGQQAALDIERVTLTLHELGDADQARTLARPLLTAPAVAEQAALTIALAGLYDAAATQDAAGVAEELHAHANRYLDIGRRSAKPRGRPRRRRRVGVISPQFSASPIYFCGIGALQALQSDVDLVFLQRGQLQDWATAEFRGLAREWEDLAHLDAAALAERITRHKLDVLLDMGGWMDPAGLRALSAKPAKRMYKWLGGQSASTGLKAFDGFISDAHQSPRELQALYTEPLVLLDGGYVTYRAPAYMPPPRVADPGIVLGIVANPVKLSRAFLVTLRHMLERWRQRGITPSLRFIEKRYRHRALQERIRLSLGGAADVQFIAPADHVAYLTELGKLSAVLDSFPYTGGLTTLEALTLGVPCYTRVGQLFCERHAYAHSRYAGIAATDCALDGLAPESLLERAGTPRRNLLENSPRVDHAGLAQALQQCWSARH